MTLGSPLVNKKFHCLDHTPSFSNSQINSFTLIVHCEESSTTWRSTDPLFSFTDVLTILSIKWINKIVPSKKPTPSKIGDDKAYSHLIPSQDSDDSGFENEKGTVLPFPVTSELRRPAVTFFTIFGKTILVLLAAWGVFNVGRYSVHRLWPAKPVSCSCGGTTVAEAKSRGCIFTPLAIAVSHSLFFCCSLDYQLKFSPVAPSTMS
jgi:hypothetical protein